MSTDLANDVCKFYDQIGMVCPPKLRLGVVTQGATDNIDHDTSSTTADEYYHGTGISVFQQPDKENQGIEQDPIVENTEKHKDILPLPEVYTSVPPAVLKEKDVTVPAVDGPVTRSDLSHLNESKDEEVR